MNERENKQAFICFFGAEEGIPLLRVTTHMEIFAIMKRDKFGFNEIEA